MADLTAAVAKSHQARHQTGYSPRAPKLKLRPPVVQSIAKYAGVLKFDKNQPRDDQGQWAKTTGRMFTSEEGYQWHETGPVAEWAKALPYADEKELSNYSSFGYHDINDQLRGQHTPNIINEFVRNATPEEMRRVGWNPEKGEWVQAVEVEKGRWERPGYPIDPRDKVTPESLEKFGSPMGKEPHQFDPADTHHQVEDGRIVVNQFYRPVEGGPPVMFTIQRPVPNLKYVEHLKERAAKIDDLIANRGYELPEAIVVTRGAYLPGVSFEQLQAMAYPGPNGESQAILEEKGFTSTMVGDAQGRAKSYPALGKSESLYKRFGDKMMGHQDEVGSAIRFHITLPAGTKVAPVEPVRRLQYDFPRIPDPAPRPPDVKEEYWTMRDFTATPTVNAKDLADKHTRSESELLLGSGARFRVTKVTHGENYHMGDMKPVPIVEMHLEYIGGGSSQGR